MRLAWAGSPCHGGHAQPVNWTLTFRDYSPPPNPPRRRLPGYTWKADGLPMVMAVTGGLGDRPILPMIRLGTATVEHRSALARSWMELPPPLRSPQSPPRRQGH